MHVLLNARLNEELNWLIRSLVPRWWWVGSDAPTNIFWAVEWYSVSDLDSSRVLALVSRGRLGLQLWEKLHFPLWMMAGQVFKGILVMIITSLGSRDDGSRLFFFLVFSKLLNVLCRGLSWLLRLVWLRPAASFVHLTNSPNLRRGDLGRSLRDTDLPSEQGHDLPSCQYQPRQP